MLPLNPPTHLGPEAGREWSRLVAELENRQLWDEATAALAEGYAANYGRWVKAEGEIRKNGEVVKLPGQDRPMRNPWLDVAQDALRLMRVFLSDLKLVEKGRDTAGAMQRVGAIEVRAPADWFVTAPPPAPKAKRGRLQ